MIQTCTDPLSLLLSKKEKRYRIPNIRSSFSCLLTNTRIRNMENREKIQKIHTSFLRKKKKEKTYRTLTQPSSHKEIVFGPRTAHCAVRPDKKQNKRRTYCCRKCCSCCFVAVTVAVLLQYCCRTVAESTVAGIVLFLSMTNRTGCVMNADERTER